MALSLESAHSAFRSRYAECDWLSGMQKIVWICQSTFHMRESYALKTQIHDPDTPTYMEALSGENPEEYFKAMDDEIQSLTRRET